MTHNSSVNFKLIHFRLWAKGSYQSPNFDTFKYSGENLPNFSSHFSNHKWVFLQILHHSSAPWKITSLYFFRSSIIYFGHKEPIKTYFFRPLSARVKICQIPMSIFKVPVNFSSSFVSFFIFMTHNSFVNSKLIHFLLWTKGSYWSLNFDIFECTVETFPNSSCQFPNQVSFSSSFTSLFIIVMKDNLLALVIHSVFDVLPCAHVTCIGYFLI